MPVTNKVYRHECLNSTRFILAVFLIGTFAAALVTGVAGFDQRAVVQPTAVATFLISILILGGGGFVTSDTIRLLPIGLPVLVLGTILGWTFYGKSNDASFRKVVLFYFRYQGLCFLQQAGDPPGRRWQ